MQAAHLGRDRVDLQAGQAQTVAVLPLSGSRSRTWSARKPPLAVSGYVGPPAAMVAIASNAENQTCCGFREVR